MRLKLKTMNKCGIFSLVAAALIIAATSAHAASIVWINTAGGNWSDTNSWNPNQIPGSGDVAVITNDGTYSVTLDVNPIIGGLVLGTAGGIDIQSLSVSNNQTFTLNGTAQVSTNGQFNLNGGVLGGNIVLCGALNCSAGTLSGGLTVNSNSVLTVSAPGVALNSLTPGSQSLTNYGTVNWTGGDISCDYSPQIYNYGLWNAQTDNSIFGQQTTGNATFNNFGIFRKSGSTNTTTIDTNAVFSGSGTVDVESGTVSIANGQNAGVVNTASGTFLSLGSSLIFGGSMTFTGTGSVEGSIIGSNAVFSGTMTCSGVTISGAITVATNCVFNLGTSNVNLSGVALTNYGTANWTGGDLDCSNSPQIYNYGLWNAETDNTFVGEVNGGSGNGVFNNYGTFRKSGGTNTTTIDTNAMFSGSGTVDVESGTVSIANGQNAGVVNTASGTFLSLGSSLIFWGSTLFTGTGLVEGSVIGSNAVFSGTMTCSGVTISGAITVVTNAIVNLGILGVSFNNGYNNTALLTNYGTINWSSDLTCDGGPQIFNFGLWNGQTDNSILGQQTTGNTTFNNYGIFRKSGGINTSTVDSNTIFTSSGTVDVESGTMAVIKGQAYGAANVAGGATLSSGNNFVFTGSTLFSGTGTIAGLLNGNNALFSGVLNCSGTTLTGTITVVTNSVLNLGTSNVNLSGVVLTNYGTANWTGGDLGCNNSPQIYNYGLWNAQTDNSIFGQQTSGNTTFKNIGIFRKSGGTNTTTIDTNAVFNGSGTVDVESGTVSIANGQYAGVVNIAGGATLSPGNNFVFAGSTLFSGTGNVAGLLNGNNALFRGVLNCSGTTLTGTITLVTNSVLNLGTSNVSLSGMALTNYGTANWTGGDLDCNNSPQIYNYGLWNAQTDNTFVGEINGGNGNGVFNNYGTFRKSGSSNTTTIDANAVFNGSGTVDVESGTVSIANGQNAGVVNTASGTILSLGHLVVFGGSTLFSGAGNVAGFVNGSNAVFSGAMSFSGVTISGAITIATNAIVNLGILGVSFNNGYNNTALLTNYGTINWSSGNFAGDNSPKIYNYGLWNDLSDNTFFGQQTSGNTTFNNIGTFRKSGTSGITTLDSSTVFNNTGTVDVQSGTVSILGGRTLTGGALNFGINSLNNFGHITLAGAVALTGTVSVNLNSVYTPTNGTSFALLTYGSESGVFTRFNLPAFFGWTNIYGPASFSLKIVSAPMQVLNVTNYGAIGDAVKFFANTTSNSVVVTTTNPLPTSAIGEAIEVFAAGVPTSSSNNQDLVTTIANVVNGTNIIVSQACQQTLTNTFATYGYNNVASFKAAIAAVGTDTNDIIYIPAGTYLLLPTSQSGAYSQVAIVLQRGGINFVGAGTNSTTLLSQGAWTIINNSPKRGILVEVASPITYNYPLTFSHLTMDGGVQYGNTGNHGFPASIKDGTGWDTSHDAFLTWCVSSASLYQIYFTNVLVQHWRGEEFKSIDQPTNSTIGIYNSTFADGNATALNVYESWDVRSNLFANLFQVAEYYQQYYTYPSYFEYNVITNITGNGFAINGGKGSNPPFYMESNVFYFSQNNGIETVPADNLFVIGNLITNVGNYTIDFDLSAAGYQGTFYNSNIVIAANTIVNPYIFVELGGGSGPTDLASVMNASINNNVLLTNGNNTTVYFCANYGGWTTNISFTGNNLSFFHAYAFTSASLNNPYAFVNTNNLYAVGILTDGELGYTNKITYAGGSRYNLVYPYSTNLVIYLDDTHPGSIPIGAQILFMNNTSNAKSVPIYPSSNLQITPIMVPYGQTLTFYWQPWASAWSTNNKPPPPTGVRLNF